MTIKKNYKFISLAVLAIGLLLSKPTSAQLGDAGAILRAGQADANKIMEAYLSPFGEGFGAAMNTGWFTTAGPHSTLGFDISIGAGLAMVPSSAQEFDVSDLALTAIQVQAGTPSVTPTLSGEDATETVLEVRETNPLTNLEETIAEFDMPAGIGVPYVPSPTVQASVGIIKSTDISLRFAPQSDIGDYGSIGLFGFGFKHDITQWLPGGKLIPVDISVQFGYTKLNMDADFDVDPETGSDIYNPYASAPETWDNQGVEFEASGYTINAIVGKKLPIIAVFAGVGIESSKTTVSTPGSYPVTSFNPNYNPASSAEDTREKRIEKVDGPIDLEFDGANSFRAFAGLEIKLAVFKLYANYTQSTYSAINAGFGISFR